LFLENTNISKRITFNGVIGVQAILIHTLSYKSTLIQKDKAILYNFYLKVFGRFCIHVYAIAFLLCIRIRY